MSFLPQRKIFLIIPLIVLSAALLLVALSLATKHKSQTPLGFSIVSEDFGGPFTLIDQNGQAYTDKSFSGRWRLIYFGFTYCPAICPTELAKITRAMSLIGSDADNILPVFITVDPERDTPDVVKNYLQSFHPSFVGLTGTVEQVEQAKKGYKVYSTKVQDPSMTDYTVDHSSFIYFMDPDNNLQAIYKVLDTADDIARDVRQRMDSYIENGSP